MHADEIERLALFEEDYWWHRGRQSIVERVLRRYAAKGGRVLDVGCGTGATTEVLAGFGTVCGGDIGIEALRHARDRGVRNVRLDAAHLPVRAKAFRTIVALDVLEHLDDDLAAARQILEALEPNGVLLVTVPAYQFLWSSHDEALGHRRRYRRGEVERVLREAGFEVEFASYVMSTILPAAVGVRLLERVLPAKEDRSQSGYMALPGPLNTLLARIVGLGGFLVGRVRLPFGLSIIAVARRPVER